MPTLATKNYFRRRAVWDVSLFHESTNYRPSSSLLHHGQWNDVMLCAWTQISWARSVSWDYTSVRLGLRMEGACLSTDWFPYKLLQMYQRDFILDLISLICQQLSNSRKLPTAAAPVRARVRSCGICGERSDTGAGFLRVLRFPLPIFIPPIAPQPPLSIIWGWYNRPMVAAVPSGLSLTPLRIIKKY
jgi:hypothetical protein